MKLSNLMLLTSIFLNFFFYVSLFDFRRRVKVELHDAGGSLVASLFREDTEKFFECSVTKLMLYITKVGKK
jgi:hypothetical protein